MAASLLAPPPGPPLRKQWTLEECDRIGAVVDLQRYELINGELLEKVSKNLPHMRSGAIILEWLRQTFGGYFVLQEATVPVTQGRRTTNAPEPDITVLNCPIQALTDRPQPHQVRLAVEISDSTLEYDLTTKRDLYARAGIAEYWVADVRAPRIVVHRDPVDGRYRNIESLGPEASISTLAAPDVRIRVGELF